MEEVLLKHTEARFAHDLFHCPPKFTAPRTCTNLFPSKQAAKRRQQVSLTLTPVSTAEVTFSLHTLFYRSKILALFGVGFFVSKGGGDWGGGFVVGFFLVVVWLVVLLFFFKSEGDQFRLQPI